VTEFPDDSPRAREAREAEDWLRRELEFLRGAERRFLRRARLREEAWRAAAVAFILAIFALCWYLAALGTGAGAGAPCSATRSAVRAGTGRALPAVRPRTATGSGSAVSGRAGCP